MLLNIPLVYLISVLPAWYFGRPLQDLLLIYGKQITNQNKLTLNAPNFYQWISNHLFSIFLPLGILMTGIIVLILIGLTYRSCVQLTPDRWITLALLFALVIPFFLPKMHDRYFFLADILSIIFACYHPRFYLLPIIIQGASLSSYLNYFQGGVKFLLPYSALGIAGVILILFCYSWESIFKISQKT